MENLTKKFLSINEAAQYLGVSEATLRRWDDNGTFKATFRSPGAHRYYSQSDLEKKTKGIFRLAFDWASSAVPYIPESDFYCSTSDRFKARHEIMAHEFEKVSALRITGSLISSAAGEVGNNSYDHNLGNWPDILGAFFAYDLGKRRIVLADRGVGVLVTLRRVRPKLSNHKEALHVAFTEFITGRAPEHRGNGLKYVRQAIIQAKANFIFQSGDAILEVKKNKKDFVIKKAANYIRGCLFLLEF